MTPKKIVVGDYTDPDTGIRFIEDDRGNYHCIPDHSMNVTIDNHDEFEKENRRLKRILEKLRSENNWLWSAIEMARKEWKKTNARKAMEGLEKAIKERER